MYGLHVCTCVKTCQACPGLTSLLSAWYSGGCIVLITGIMVMLDLSLVVACTSNHGDA